MPKIPLPRPWRLMLDELQDVDSNSAGYMELLNAFMSREEHEIPVAAMTSCGIDSQENKFQFTFANGQTGKADFSVIGMHDGEYFYWADTKPNSFEDKESAIQARAAIAESLEILSKDDKIAIGLRDMNAILALAAVKLNLPNTVMAPGGNYNYAIALRNLSISAPTAVLQLPKKQSLLEKVLNKKKEKLEPPSTLEMMRHFITSFGAPTEQLPPDRLLSIEARMAEIKNQYDQNDYAVALQAIEGVKKELGEMYGDQEPAGWLLLCEGVCQLEMGNKEDAVKAFNLTSSTIAPPTRKIVQLGLARASAQEFVTSNIVALFIRYPDDFKDLVTTEEREVAMNAIAQQEDARLELEDNPESTLKQVIDEEYALARRQFDLSKAAETHREVSSVMCEEDVRVREVVNSEYRMHLLKWYTMSRNSASGGYSSHPDENPEMVKSFETKNHTEDSATICIDYDGMHGLVYNYRYILVKNAIVNGGSLLWRVSEVWSSLNSDGDEYRCR